MIAAIDFYWSLDGWIILAGVLCALSCTLLGTYMVLRQMSMMGDAISHAVLPGLAIAFLITHSRSSGAMLIGAILIGVVTALLTQAIMHLGRVDRGASMGVVFTTLFAVGLMLIHGGAAENVDLDPGCVLYGAIEFTPGDLVSIAGIEIPRTVLTLGGMYAANVLFVGLFWKELKISSFDPALATTLGVNATLMHYLLMTMVAATTVVAFEAVGSVLVVALLIVPAAIAHLLTERLVMMVLVGQVIAAACGVLGHLGAIAVPPWFGLRGTNTAGMIATVAGLLFVLAVIFAPRHGVLARLIHRGRVEMPPTAESSAATET